MATSIEETGEGGAQILLEFSDLEKLNALKGPIPVCVECLVNNIPCEKHKCKL